MSAVFSPCRTWRYTLTRSGLCSWNPGVVSENAEYPKVPTLMFVCLNPSTADETLNDPTVRRCIGYARAWGFISLTVCNIFGLRSTDPKALYVHPDPAGPDNLKWIRESAADANMIVCGWGNHGNLHGQGDRVRAMLELDLSHKLHVLGLNAGGQPKHPLYLRGDLKPQRWLGL